MSCWGISWTFRILNWIEGGEIMEERRGWRCWSMLISSQRRPFAILRSVKWNLTDQRRDTLPLGVLSLSLFLRTLTRSSKRRWHAVIPVLTPTMYPTGIAEFPTPHLQDTPKSDTPLGPRALFYTILFYLLRLSRRFRSLGALLERVSLVPGRHLFTNTSHALLAPLPPSHGFGYYDIVGATFA